jgi:hypothetical protein
MAAGSTAPHGSAQLAGCRYTPQQLRHDHPPADPAEDGVIERGPDDPDAEDHDPGDESYLRQVGQRTEERKLINRPR